MSNATPAEIAKKTLEDLNIPFQEFSHPAVFTCEEANRHCPPMPGAKAKNLFLKDSKEKQYYLVCLAEKQKISLKELSQLIGVKGLSFASERRLKEVLGVEPGSVGILALINDTGKKTHVLIDKELMNDQWFRSHPLVNTATICLKTSELERFLKHTGHSSEFINL